MKQTQYLCFYDGSRRNNFTALRFMLAWMVIFAHSFALQPAPGVHMPLGFLLLGSTTTGQMAVDGFFAVSGFLVAGSLVNRGLIDYTLSRVLRLLPGLIICVLLTVFLVGPLVTSLPVKEYFSRLETYQYLYNALAFPFARFTLPGVFEGNTVTSVNGSLWSISYEVRCYMALGIVGLVGVLENRKYANVLFTIVAFALLLSYVDPKLLNIQQHVSSALLCFVIGVAFFCNRDKLVLNVWLALVALLALYLSFGEPWFRYIYPLAWVYFLFYLAYQTRFLNVDEKIGDCSYGIYIYAFPLQQLIAYLMPSGTPYTNMVISTAAIVPLALLSWIYVEKPALNLKSKYLTRTPVVVN
jgi:peptidoglycan/LPS O-acetylase OafA/YrhL